MATQKFSKDDISMEYHCEVYLNVSLSQVLEKEGMEQEFVLEVKSGASRRIIDASKEICFLHPNNRRPGRLANHSQLKSNGANMKPTVIDLFQNGKIIVVFRATRDILPFEQLRFDYKGPIANQLSRNVKFLNRYLTDGIVRTLRLQNTHLFVVVYSFFHSFRFFLIAILYLNTDCYKYKCLFFVVPNRNKTP